MRKRKSADRERLVNAHQESRVDEPARHWTFLTNHGHVLVYLNTHPDARVRDVAEAVGITERSAHSILHELEADAYLTKVKTGRRNTYRVHPTRKFRHPAEATRPVGELLRIFDPPTTPQTTERSEPT
jgi:DNA-binding MarR family transcriptional regulator